VSSVSAPADRRRPSTPSLRPALIVAAVAVVVVLGGVVLALAGTPSARQAPSGIGRHIAGVRLSAEPAQRVLSHISSAGEPPADIVGSLAVPAGSLYLGKAANDAGVNQFDRQVRIEVNAPLAEVKDFFVAALSQQRWVTRAISAPSPGAFEVIAEKSGSDGYQWRIGITMKGGHALVAPALAGGGGSSWRTTVAIRLYQVEDAS
jgi:hypothetical protein